MVEPARIFGYVIGISGLVVTCRGLPNSSMGSRCQIETVTGKLLHGEVVGYKNDDILIMPFGSVEGIGPNCKVFASGQGSGLKINSSMVGRVLNALGEPIDGKGSIACEGEILPLKASPPPPGKRNAIGPKLDVGVKAINTFIPICKGQRMGIFSGSGVGKSVLMSMMARFDEADINVIGLVGERGREVKEFIDDYLGEEGLKKSVIIVATGDEPPLMRRMAAYLTMTIAEYFRDTGKDVLLMMDSVTRFALAQREIGLSAGEPPTTRGFTPSVFSELPRLMERAGPGEGSAGTITAIFTVLVEGGDLDEPVADAVRGIIDGHIVLDRKFAERGHFPAIDILKSVSRMMPACHSAHENILINKAKELLSTYASMEELIRLGAYKEGSDSNVDTAINYHEPLSKFLQQSDNEGATMAESFATLETILKPLLGNISTRQ